MASITARVLQRGFRAEWEAAVDELAIKKIQLELFSDCERWGWEFVFDGPPRRSPDLDREPQWAEPAFADRVALNLALETTKVRTKKALVWGWAGVILGGLSLGSSDGGSLLFLLAGVAALVWAYSSQGSAKSHLQRREREWSAERDRVRAAFAKRHEQWRQAIALHDEAERKRVYDDDLWFPLSPVGTPGRIDVFGGTPAGWASLLVTAGSSLLGSDKSILVLDLSEERVSADLATLAATSGYAVEEIDLPEKLPDVDLLGGLDRDAATELLTAATYSVSTDQRDSRDVRAFDGDIISTVVSSLDAPYSFSKVSAALRTLMGQYRDASGPLSDAERARLLDEVDFVGGTERAQDRLRMLRILMDLVRDAGSSEEAEPLGAPTGVNLRIVATGGHNERRKSFVDALVTQSLRHRLDAAPHGENERVLMVVGADDLGTETLERLAKRAAQARVRLVYVFEHLREEVRTIVGGGASSTIFMQLGNDQEAEAAASYIGKSHSFTLSQVTVSAGRTMSQSRSVTHGTQDTISESFSGRPLLFFKNWYKDPTKTFGESTSTSSSETDSISEGTSEQEAETMARVYEFTVEPTQLQSLPQTAFFFIESSHEGRSVRLGDCNPGILTFDRVARDPRSGADAAA